MCLCVCVCVCVCVVEVEVVTMMMMTIMMTVVIVRSGGGRVSATVMQRQGHSGSSAHLLRVPKTTVWCGLLDYLKHSWNNRVCIANR
jgi:hypothetical protein